MSRCFEASDDEHRAKRQPYALGEVWVEPGRLETELAVLDDTRSTDLVGWVERHVASELRLGRNPVILDPDGPLQFIRHASFDELFERSEKRNRWSFSFVTPTVFRRGNGYHALPVPETVFQGLQERFDRFSGRAPLGVQMRDANLLAHRFNISTISVDISATSKRVGAKEAGALIGDIEYTCERGCSSLLRSMDALARFAEFSGVGAHTTAGMGRVHVR